MGWLEDFVTVDFLGNNTLQCLKFIQNDAVKNKNIREAISSADKMSLSLQKDHSYSGTNLYICGEHEIIFKC